MPNLARRALTGLLIFAFATELLFPLFGFLVPDRTLGLFKVGVTDDTRFLAFVVSWSLLFVAVICGLALWRVLRGEIDGWYLSYALGYWWIGIGIGLAAVHGRIDNLFLDTLKGLLIVVAAHLSHPRRPEPAASTGSTANVNP